MLWKLWIILCHPFLACSKVIWTMNWVPHTHSRRNAWPFNPGTSRSADYPTIPPSRSLKCMRTSSKVLMWSRNSKKDGNGVTLFMDGLPVSAIRFRPSYIGLWNKPYLDMTSSTFQLCRWSRSLASDGVIYKAKCRWTESEISLGTADTDFQGNFKETFYQTFTLQAVCFRHRVKLCELSDSSNPPTMGILTETVSIVRVSYYGLFSNSNAK